MDFCKSFLNIIALRLHSLKSIRSSSSLTLAEMVQLEALLSEIPTHCRQVIINLPPRQLLNLYRYHVLALYHGLRKEWQIAISYEQRVIKGLQVLLPADKDHYIFFNFYSILSASFLALGSLQVAIEGLHIALALLLKHTPMNYKTISIHYYHLANAYKALYNPKAMIQYLTKAIVTARLSTDLDQAYLHMLTTELQVAKQQENAIELQNPTFSEVQRNFDENDQDSDRSITAEVITLNAEYDLLQVGESEFKRLPYKQTEV